MYCEVANAGADFKNTCADVRVYDIRHPAAKTRRSIQAHQNFSSVRVFYVDLGQNRIFEISPGAP